MRPVDGDVVALVYAVAHLHYAVDDPVGKGGRQRSFDRLVRYRSVNDRSLPLNVIGWDLTDPLRRGLQRANRANVRVTNRCARSIVTGVRRHNRLRG
jgi:hypothetical protein